MQKGGFWRFKNNIMNPDPDYMHMNDSNCNPETNTNSSRLQDMV